MYLGYKILEYFTLGIHCLSFFLLFFYLDRRFLFLGYSYITTSGQVDSMFMQQAHCLASIHAPFEEGETSERVICSLNQNEHYQGILIGLWCFYTLEICIIGCYTGVQLLLCFMCLEKRWQTFWIRVDLHDFYEDVLGLKVHEIFTLGLVSKQCDSKMLLRFIKDLRYKEDLRTESYANYIG